MKEKPTEPKVFKNSRSILIMLLVALAFLFVGWLLNTPPGILGKADAVGYAVCHRIDLRSFHIGTRQIPLCARCTGMYLGAVLGLLFQFFLGRRRTAYPPKSILAFLGFLFIAFAIDGSNSLVQLLRQGNGLLYTTNNTIRLVTGTGMGLVLAAMVYPAFHQTVWKKYSEKASIENWKQFAGLLLGAAVIIVLTLSENPLVLYPLSIISVAGVLILLTMIYSMLFLIIFKKENYAEQWRDLALPLLLGLLLALTQIALLDYGRFLLTNTWTGFGF